jgi:two-component sensor histidine kinase
MRVFQTFVQSCGKTRSGHPAPCNALVGVALDKHSSSAARLIDHDDSGYGFRTASLRSPRLLAMNTPQSPRADVALNLSLAMVASSDVPLLLLDGTVSVIAASASFCQTFDIEPSSVLGQTIYKLGSGEWDRPRLRSLLNATISGRAKIDAYEMDLNREGREPRRLVLKAQKLEYGDPDNVRMLLTIADVTDARASEKMKDDLVREKAVLVQEVQHRVANSLQIIASVLMQSARNVTSDEARQHLKDAHHRVISIATVQRQLAATGQGEVGLRAYLDQLCESIGASMISDHDQLSLQVQADDSVVTADMSVSLGLVVTELVINALKHAFPDHRLGRIDVGYKSQGLNWTLSVADDGIGMPTGDLKAKPGLGTSIVEALANQLEATVSVAAAHPGTTVSLVHPKIPSIVGAADRSPTTAF